MKKKIFNTKLVLKKETISNLDMHNVTGGDIAYTRYGGYTAATCNACTEPPVNDCDTAEDCVKYSEGPTCKFKDTWAMCTEA